MAAPKKAKTEKYVVTRGNTQIKGKDCKIGQVIDLNEKQASALVNKVRLKSEMEESAGGMKPNDAAKALDAAGKRIDELENQLGDVKKENDTLKAEIESLLAK